MSDSETLGKMTDRYEETRVAAAFKFTVGRATLNYRLVNSRGVTHPAKRQKMKHGNGTPESVSLVARARASDNVNHVAFIRRGAEVAFMALISFAERHDAIKRCHDEVTYPETKFSPTVYAFECYCEVGPTPDPVSNRRREKQGVVYRWPRSIDPAPA